MYILTDSQKLQYELSNVVKLFFPAEDTVWITDMNGLPVGETVIVPTVTDSRCVLKIMAPNGMQFSNEIEYMPHDNTAIVMGKLLYKFLADKTNKELSWGVLTGIRPVKLARAQRLKGKSFQEIENYFINEYYTSPAKAHLCAVTDDAQKNIVSSSLQNGYSLYISVPFCPSRCSYCSFVSHSIEKTWKLIPEYVDKVCIELEETAKITRENNLILQSIYIGGGTPTVLTAEQLEKVILQVKKCFDLSNCKEFTVEAGRPDTITKDKLIVMKNLGVDRISVNCQTLNDTVLESIGRKHTAKEFYDAYALVHEHGFTVTNVDLIAGLPGDTFASFKDSLKKVVELNPENITVHSLTVKRAAKLQKSKADILTPHKAEVSDIVKMVDFSQEFLEANGYMPYYLYRQKGTVESLENVGFCKGETQCIYNVYIMDETHTILSVGAGGVTKLVMPSDNAFPQGSVRIERLFNHKYPYEYIDRFNEILDKKQKISEFPLPKNQI